MKIVFKIPVLAFIIISLCGNCFADIERLSDDQLGDFITTEGVCNVKVVDGCNTSTELKLVMELKKTKVDLTNIEINSNNVPEGSIDLSKQMKELYGIVEEVITSSEAVAARTVQVTQSPVISSNIIIHNETPPLQTVTLGQTYSTGDNSHISGSEPYFMAHD